MKDTHKVLRSGDQMNRDNPLSPVEKLPFEKLRLGWGWGPDETVRDLENQAPRSSPSLEGNGGGVL